MPANIESVLFCCTGNVFRSLTAEHTLRRELALRGRALRVSSAGTEDRPQWVRPYVRDYLAQHGLDVSAHTRRTLTQTLLDDADLVVAMSLDHRDYIRSQFAYSAPLFLELCAAADSSSYELPDVNEAVPDFLTNKPAAESHMRLTIDRIIQVMPSLAERICAGQIHASRPAR